MVGVAKKPKGTSVLALTRFGMLCRALSGLKALTEQEIVDMLGRVQVQTLPQVAQAFELSPHTINQSWRQAGMPGVSGRWDLAEILAWRLARDFEQAEKQRSRPTESKEELEKKILALKIETMEDERKIRVGQYVDVTKGQSQVAKAMAVFRESELSISGQIAPMLPAEIAPNICHEIDKLQRYNLTGLHESLLKAVKS